MIVVRTDGEVCRSLPLGQIDAFHDGTVFEHLKFESSKSDSRGIIN